MECWCDEPLWGSQLKSSLNVILGHCQWGHFEEKKKTFTIQSYWKISLPVSPKGIIQ